MVVWENVKLENLMRIETGSRNTEDKIDGGRYPFFVRSQDIERINSYSYDCEAVLTAGDGVGTGKVFHHINGKFDAHQRVYVMSQFNGIEGKYFYYYFSRYFSDEVSKYTAKSSVDSVRRAMIADMKIPLPELPEQRRIATALSDADTYIAALEMLIAKKRAIKQGAMQELLTGKRRLEGFEGEWEIRTLESMCYLVTKQTGFDYTTTIKPSLLMKHTKGYIPFIQNKDFEGEKINLKTDFYVPLEVAQQFPNILLNQPCLLVSISGRIGNVGYFNGQQLAFIGGAVGIARFNNPANIKWTMLYLQSSEGQKMIFANEKAGAQHNLTVEDIRKFEIPYPQPDEQISIDEILSDMDSEIDALTTKLEKVRRIKQGMMSELLTGRIRLIKEDTDNGKN